MFDYTLHKFKCPYCGCEFETTVDAYEEKEVKDLYLVYGTIDESGDMDTWVADVFDDIEQAKACAEWYNTVKTQENVYYYASSDILNVNKLDYIEELKKLRGRL